MLSITCKPFFAECGYAQFHCAECHYTKRRGARHFGQSLLHAGNRTPRIHQCRKTIVLSCNRCLIDTGVEKKNELHLNIQ
jgi:hypothetical protein